MSEGRNETDVHNAGDVIRAADILTAYIEEGPHSPRYLDELHLVVAEYDCAQIVGAVVALATAALQNSLLTGAHITERLRAAAQALASDDVGRVGAMWADPDGGDPTCPEQ